MPELEYFSVHAAGFVTAAALLGLIIGSFLNVVIFRLPTVLEREWRSQCSQLLDCQDSAQESAAPFNLIVPRSHCPVCGHTIAVLENVPVLSYLWLRGRCSSCDNPISFRYPAVEILSGILTALIAWQFGFGPEAIGAMVLTWALIALTFIDLDHQLLPDSITMPLLWLGLSLNLFGLYTSLEASLMGAIAGYGILWLVYHLFRLATGKEGMGFGDFKLMAVLGAWLGWQALPIVILLSSAVGAVVGLMLVFVGNRDRNVPIPFGPYIALAGWIALLWGKDLTAWYLSLSGPI
jgi:leader peptidase (prepilin peptidase)/N-methyltransferase